MKVILLALALLLQPSRPGVYRLTQSVADLGEVRYALSLPDGYTPRQARPLVVALHPGGGRFAYYGGAFMEQVVAPGLHELGAIIVAPDCPTQSWTDPNAERAVLAIVRRVMTDYEIDRRRVLVTGFSLGGRGTWFMASRHEDLFTAAIVMAGAPGSQPLDRLATKPTYVIHSREDEVVPFAPTDAAVRDLKRMGRAIEIEALDGVGHFDMGTYVDPLSRAGQWVVEQWKQ